MTDKDEALEELAKELFFIMEKLDPTDDPSAYNWGSISDRDREFFRICVKRLLHRRELLETALRCAD